MTARPTRRYTRHDDHADRGSNGRIRLRPDAGAPPPRAARALLPDAGLVHRRRGPGPGDVPAGLAAPRPARAGLEPAGLAVPDRYPPLNQRDPHPPAAS